MSVLYNEYLTGADREAAIIIAESDAFLAKIDVLMEAVKGSLDADKLAAEAKVFAENGTYEDLEILYTEAEKEAGKKTGGILKTIIDGIISVLNSIGDFLTKHFGKNIDKAIDAIPTDNVNVDPSIKEEANIFTNAWNAISGTIEKIKTGNFNGIGDVLNTFAPIVAGLGGVAVGTAAAIPVSRQWLKEKMALATDKIVGICKPALTAAKTFLVGSDVDLKSEIKNDDNLIVKFLKHLSKLCSHVNGWIRKVSAKINGVVGKFKLKRNQADAGTSADSAEKDLPKNSLAKQMHNQYQTAKQKKEDQETMKDMDGMPMRTESVSIFGVDVDDIVTESSASEEDLNELFNLFEEL